MNKKKIILSIIGVLFSIIVIYFISLIYCYSSVFPKLNPNKESIQNGFFKRIIVLIKKQLEV